MARRPIFAMLFVVLAVQAAAALDAPNVPSRVFCVQEYGAVGDGTKLNTAAIQKAIDTCSAAGGGTVYFPPGEYLSGTIYLKDNVRLYLEVNAVLRGSPRKADYPPIPRKNALGEPAFTGGFLIYADKVRNVSIEGRGTIDGQGSAFWFKEMLGPLVRKPMPDRPRALVCIIKGTSLLFRDVSLINSPCYTLWLIGCDDAKIEGITIRNPHEGPNTDGIDIDCCSKVCISNCSIDGGDDAIAIKSDSGTLLEDKPCEDIAVTNCTLCSVPACGVRIGYEGDAVIRNCTLSNLTIYNTDIGIDVISILPARRDFPILKGTRCENIAFDNIVMRQVKRPIYLWMGNERGGDARMSLKNISISNVMAQSQFGCYVGGYPPQKAEDIFLSNIRLLLTGEMPSDAPHAGAGVWGGMVHPYALYCSHVDGLRIRDFSVDFRKASGPWRHVVFCEDTRDATISGLHSQGFAARSSEAVVGSIRSQVIVDDKAEKDSALKTHP
jgi:polygalacturonase